jgi:hypothetical protein
MLGGVCVMLTCKGRARALKAEVANAAYDSRSTHRDRTWLISTLTLDGFLPLFALVAVLAFSVLAALAERVVGEVSSEDLFLPIFALH